MAARPQNIGVKAIEIYFPSQYVEQSELEKFDGVAAGKYTIGLGQTKMAFCDDREDIYSMALTVNGAAKTEDGKTSLDRFDYMTFHAPTCKLVQKSYARLLYHDFLANADLPAFAEVAPELRDMDYEKSLTDKAVEKAFMGLTKKRFQERVNPAIQVATMCGNMYCASVWGGLASLLSLVPSKDLEGKRIGLFSYGSGLAASFMSFRVNGSVENISKVLDISTRLEARRAVPPATYDEMCNLRKQAHLQKDYTPKGETSTIIPGAYYLTKVDDMFKREYAVQA
ncbi:Hydroxymethylglutaryl-CoA synthase [Beauveria bassiana]|uniref:Hydroxymethylglutaryl-CoA synthase n=1 Tax=Beauveria bassiana TaxID=176275 RepID=A0A2N6NXP5_BEABA|nr:Hydroxymethylglutaryl-CoA synthase [Beauveria bassiana]